MAKQAPHAREPQTEQELADFYQAHKDDPDIWGDPEPAPRRPGRPSKGLSATITVRFTPEEVALIRKAAQITGAPTYSEILRNALKAYGDQLGGSISAGTTRDLPAEWDVESPKKRRTRVRRPL